jgi:hypothetical protein
VQILQRTPEKRLPLANILKHKWVQTRSKEKSSVVVEAAAKKAALAK